MSNEAQEDGSPTLPVAPGATIAPALSDDGEGSDVGMARGGGVVVATFASVMEADLARAHLASEQIEAWLVDDNVGSVMPHLGMAEGVKVTVAKEDEGRAHTAMAAYRDAQADRLQVAPESVGKLANRALAASMLGMIVPPFGNLYSLAILWRLRKLANEDGWTAGALIKGGAALALDAGIVGLCGYVVFLMLS